jgi:hypothetical protein
MAFGDFDEDDIERLDDRDGRTDPRGGATTQP